MLLGQSQRGRPSLCSVELLIGFSFFTGMEDGGGVSTWRLREDMMMVMQ